MMSQPSVVSIGGGDRPILPASHQAPSRASSSTVWSPQLWRSGEKDSHILAFADAVCGTGQWISAQRPPNCRGKNAASLSSGDMIAPRRSKLRKSLVIEEGDQRPGARVSGVRDGILIQRRELHDA